MVPNVCLLNVIFDPAVGDTLVEDVHTLIRNHGGRIFGFPALNPRTGSYEVLFVVDRTRTIARLLNAYPGVIRVEEMLDHIS